MLTHPVQPVWDSGSRILILGSFPSVRSREEGFYYGHPRNRFWPLMEAMFSEKLISIDDKVSFLHRRHIALSDVILSCDIEGSADASISNAVPNDIRKMLDGSQIHAIYANGAKAAELYARLIGIGTAVRLPSTSPANAAWPLERLLDEWRQILDMLGVADERPQG